MRRRSYGSALLFIVAAIAAIAMFRYAPPADAAELRAAEERARLRAHFDQVDAELRARDIGALSPAQRAARTRHIAELRRYRDGGVFPVNTDFAERATPYFVDRQGTLCAMAHLVAASGRADLVARIAATRNNAFIVELADDAALVAWLDSAGLSLEEAARIQPAYGGWFEPEDEGGSLASHATTSVMSGVANGITIALNARRARTWSGVRWRGGLGVAAGLAGIGLGATKLDSGGDVRTLGAVNVMVGSAAAFLGVRHLVLGPAAATEQVAGGARASGRSAPMRVAITPTVGPRSGVALHVAF